MGDLTQPASKTGVGSAAAASAPAQRTQSIIKKPPAQQQAQPCVAALLGADLAAARWLRAAQRWSAWWQLVGYEDVGSLSNRAHLVAVAHAGEDGEGTA